MLRLTLEQIIHEPGAVFTIMAALAFGFVVSKKGNPIVQIGLLGLAVMHLLYKDATLLGKFWMWAIIFGFGVHRLGLHYGLLGLMNGIKARLQSAATAGRPVRQETSYTDEPERTYRRTTSDYRSSRGDEYQQRNAEYERRQQQREEEEEEETTKSANAKKAAAKKEQAEKRKKKSAPKPPPKQEEKPPPPPPKDPPPKPTPPPKRREWYEVLGVSSTASLSEIKKARNAKAMQFHSDKIQHMSETFKQEAEEELKAINAAFETAKTRRK